MDVPGGGGSHPGACVTGVDVHELHLGLQPHSQEAPLQRLREGEGGNSQSVMSVCLSLSVCLSVCVCVCMGAHVLCSPLECR